MRSFPSPALISLISCDLNSLSFSLSLSHPITPTTFSMSSPSLSPPHEHLINTNPTPAAVEATLPPAVGALKTSCNHCDALEAEPCLGCGMVSYCKLDHRVLDIGHDAICREIQEHQSKIAKLPNEDTSQYTARHGLVSILYEMDTHIAISASLIHAMDVLKHDRRDRYCMREEIPFILLRLGMDQICYDFCVAWTNEEQMFLDPAVTYDFEDAMPFAIPAQDMMNMYEYRFDVENKEYFPHAVAMVLLKLRVLMRIMSVPETRALSKVLAQSMLMRQWLT